MDIRGNLDAILRRVEKPGRYVGGETNAVVKDSCAVRASVCLAFPDVYDIGMSYHGYKILYELINRRAGWAAERTFAPWPDMEDAMREAGLPLFALESKRPIREFDLIGFTLQHEVNYTNILNMIDLAGLPLESAERRDPFPLIIGGGEGALAPEPLAPFIDIFVFGDGEGPLMELMELVERVRGVDGSGAKAQGEGGRKALLREAAKIPGVYVPAFYEERRDADGAYAGLRRTDSPDSPPPSFRKTLYDLRSDMGPVRPVVPNLRVVHDRLAIEIKRGCTRGCRFCSAGMITRPVRERVPDQIVEIAREGIRNTGFDEVSLLSLSSADYSCVLPAVRMLRREFEGRNVSVSMPSLRINAFDVSLADEISQMRKTGFTFAPEAGTPRLRRVINKPVEEEIFLKIIEKVCQKGWRTLKFYFMIGLPTETDADLDGIVSLVRQAERIGRHYWGRALQINVGLSPYVPKPHTPFQWHGQTPIDEMDRRYRYVAARLRPLKCVSVKTHDRRLGFIEAVLAKGDRRVGHAMRRAWELGAKLDGWGEHFNFNAWTQAFEETGVDPHFYANRERGKDEPFPWDHVDAGLGRKFLWKEWFLARKEMEVADCSTHKCTGCVSCDDNVDHQMADEAWQASPELLRTEGRYDDFGQSPKSIRPELRKSRAGRLHARLTPVPTARPDNGNGHGRVDGHGNLEVGATTVIPVDDSALYEGLPARDRHEPPRLDASRPPKREAPPSVQRIEFRIRREGNLKYLSHLDVLKVVQLACNRAGFSLAYSRGFNPKPRLRLLPPLPLGYADSDGVADVMLTEWVEPEAARAALDAALPAEMSAFAAKEIPLKSQAPEVRMAQATFHVKIPGSAAIDLNLNETRVNQRLAAFKTADSVAIEKRGKGGERRKIDLKRAIIRVGSPQWDGCGGFEVEIEASYDSGFVDPLAALAGILGESLTFKDGADVTRTQACLRDAEEIAAAASGRVEQA